MAQFKQALIQKRKRVQELAQQGCTTGQIAKKLLVSLPFVRKWLHTSDVSQDGRGWAKGMKRSRTAEEEARILTIREALITQKAFYRGSVAIQQVYEQQVPGAPVPPTWFIERVLRAHGVVQRYQPHPRRGGAQRRHYPARSVRALGPIVEEIDFIGPRFIQGTGDPFYLLSRRYTQPQPWARLDRILSQGLTELLPWLVADWQTRAPKPDVLTVDDFLTFTASGRPRGLSRFTVFLLNCCTTPVLLPPNSPWSHASVESANSQFAKKLWEVETFASEEALDARLTQFNAANLAYRRVAWTGLPPFAWLEADFTWDDSWLTTLKTLHAPALYLVRKVDEHQHRVAVHILKEWIPVPPAYLGLFLLARVDLVKQRLFLFFEQDDGQLLLVHEQPYVTLLPDPK